MVAFRRTILPLLTAGLGLLAASLLIVARDVASARGEVEGEMAAFAETGALTIPSLPTDEIRSYLSGLIRHPAIASATVYSSTGERTTERRPSSDDPGVIAGLIPSLKDPVVGCRALDTSTLCVSADAGHYHRRFRALIVPHVILLAATAFLLVVTLVLAGGTNRGQIRELTRIIRGATGASDYSVRASAVKGEIGDLAGATNALLEQMQQRDLMLRRRTTELESVNRELEAFSYSVSHDLRSPLASVDGFTQALQESSAERLDESEKEYLKWIQDGIEQMKNLVAGLLQMSRITRSELTRARVNLSAVAQSIAQSLIQRDPARPVEFRITPDLVTEGDERLLHAVLENLMSNAYKFTGKTEKAVIQVGVTDEAGRRAYFVKDNGAGFDATQAAKMFTPFQRLHSSSEFEGTGIGLATVKRIVERHGGAIWADGRVGLGATFYFTLGESTATGRRAETGELTRV